MAFDIYQNKTQFKFFFVAIALVLGIGSLIYTNLLVNKLAERERKIINLYAQALTFTVNPEISDDLTFILSSIINTNSSIPVILLKNGKILSSRNIDFPKNASKQKKNQILVKELEEMKQQYEPIPVDFGDKNTKSYIYYRNSDILLQLRYYPLILLLVVFVFGFFTYLAFSYSRRAEQNRVWVGLAKETAHQLGTPISSLMAWIDYLRTDDDFDKEELILELSKDIKRLETVTARFSNIGSTPTMMQEDIYFITLGAVNYLQKRISAKVKIEIQNDLPKQQMLKLNRYLFEWVLENLCKNAVDAMGEKGELNIHLFEQEPNKVVIDLKDNGKGISIRPWRKIFHPGFTTKKRGWGLGLTLTKRIIEEYHEGKIFVLHSEPNVGTIFRIILNKSLA